MRHPTIYNSGEFVLLNGDMAERDNLYIEWGTYGADSYSVHICLKQTNSLFGNTTWTDLTSQEKVLEVVRHIKRHSGITTIRKFEDV